MRQLLFIFILALALGSGFQGRAQKFITKTGYVRFYSEAPLEKIEAVNRQVKSALDAATGDFVFTVLMKSFVFEKALMQEHFHENYVESDKFPNATFIGKVTNLKEVNFGKDGTYPVTVDGKLTIHGETKTISEKGTLEIREGKVIGRSKFSVTVADYKITIPNTVVNNISKTLEITVDVVMDKVNP
jgi:polyisoprenoid-binding protein YceI